MKKIKQVLVLLLILGVVGFNLYNELKKNQLVQPVETVEREQTATSDKQKSTTAVKVEYGQAYTSKEEVAQYLVEFKELPPNYITKQEAYDAGWVPDQQNLWEVTDHKSIGGDRFSNREGKLPKKMTYYEADIDYKGKGRNAKRIVYSNNFDIYYTDDHYETFKEITP